MRMLVLLLLQKRMLVVLVVLVLVLVWVIVTVIVIVMLVAMRVALVALAAHLRSLVHVAPRTSVFTASPTIAIATRWTSRAWDRAVGRDSARGRDSSGHGQRRGRHRLCLGQPERARLNLEGGSCRIQSPRWPRRWRLRFHTAKGSRRELGRAALVGQDRDMLRGAGIDVMMVRRMLS